MYAIVKTGGKQYRVEEGQSLLVERLRAEDGSTASLEPLLVVDGSNVVDGEDLAKASVEARVVGHERGPKLRVVKFKPKRGYKRRTGHRQELTRIEVTSIKLGGRRAAGSSSRRAPKPVAAEEAEATATSTSTETVAAEGAEVTAAESTAAEQPVSAAAPAEKKPARRRAKPAAEEPKAEEDDGA
jgi:large subunit ribosomal protein L21